MVYESNKEKKIGLFKKFLTELKEDYISSHPNLRKLDYQLTIIHLCGKMNIYPKDAVKFLDMAIEKGELEEKREIFLSKKIVEELGKEIVKNKPVIEKEIKESGL